MNKFNFKEYFSKYKNVKIDMAITVGLFVVTIFLAFSAGVFVGLEKARFSYRWGDNYYHNFVGQPDMFPDRKYMNARGAFGEIIKIDGSDILVKGEDGKERNILAATSTSIKSGDADLKISDLKNGDKVIVIGSPNDQGQLEAKFIRIAPSDFRMPPPPPGMEKINNLQ